MYKCPYCGKQYASAKDVSTCYYQDLIKKENDKLKEEEIRKKIKELDKEINKLKEERKNLTKQITSVEFTEDLLNSSFEELLRLCSGR